MQLEKMRKEWRAIGLDLEEYKNSKTYFLRGADDIRTLLDDQILKTQSMRGSPFIKPFEVKARQWEERLQQMSAILDEWMVCSPSRLPLLLVANCLTLLRFARKRGCTWSPFSARKTSCARCPSRAVVSQSSTRSGAKPWRFAAREP